jgi:hypothetical protein
MAKGIITGSAIRIQGGQYVISTRINNPLKETPKKSENNPQKLA